MVNAITDKLVLNSVQTSAIAASTLTSEQSIALTNFRIFLKKNTSGSKNKNDTHIEFQPIVGAGDCLSVNNRQNTNAVHKIDLSVHYDGRSLYTLKLNSDSVKHLIDAGVTTVAITDSVTGQKQEQKLNLQGNTAVANFTFFTSASSIISFHSVRKYRIQFTLPGKNP